MGSVFSAAANDVFFSVFAYRRTLPRLSTHPLQIPPEDAALWEQAQRALSGGGGSSSLGSSGGAASGSDSGSGGGLAGAGDTSDAAADAGVTLDWKGDPIKFSPGDKLPFKFL